ncbi:glycosyltransferase [Flavobacteriaceae bacterium]|nr:glycosyltransferase [Flavobacteriaceae bacterium]
MKNNILIVIPSLKKGGTETQLKILIYELTAKGYVITIAVRKNNFDKRDFENINFIELEDKGFISIKSLYRLHIFIKKEKPIFVYSFLRQMNIMTGFLNYFSKFNWLSSERSNPNYLVGQMSFYDKLEILLKRRSLVVCNSSIAKKFYTTNNYNAYYLSNFLKYKRQTKVSYDKKFIIVNRLIKTKRVNDILIAWSTANINSELVIVGNGPELVNLKAFSDKLKLSNVRFLGEVEDPSDLLLSSSFFISSSEREGMPNAALEALCHNNILILSDIEIHREILISDEKYIFKLGSTNELSNTLISAYNLSKNNFDNSLNKQLNYLKNYNNHKNTEKFLKFLSVYFKKPI